METLSKDLLFTLALEFSLPDLLRFCSSSKRINELVCQHNDIWNRKLQEFDNEDVEELKQDTPRNTYTLLYKLSKLRRGLHKSYHRLSKLYNEHKLYLTKSDINYIPPEIGILKNLVSLEVSHNNLENLPDEIGDLENLKELYLDNNQLTNLPHSIGRLTNLEYLDLSGNKLINLPIELSSLEKLIRLFVDKETIVPEKLEKNRYLKIIKFR